MALTSFARENASRDAQCEAAAKKAGYADWWDWVRAIEKELDREICGAPLRKKYRPCRSHPAPNGRCSRYHGGKALIGPAHPNYVDGATSKIFDYLPAYLQDKADAVFEDEKLVQSREQIAVLDAHAKDMLTRGLESGESGAAWMAIGTYIDHALHALAQKDDKVLRESLQQAKQIARDGVGEVAVWREYRQVTDDMRRHRETELTRMKYLSAFVAADHAKAVFGRLLKIISTHVHDTSVLRLILNDVDEAFGRGAKQEATGT